MDGLQLAGRYAISASIWAAVCMLEICCGMPERVSGSLAYFPATLLSGFLNFRPRCRGTDARYREIDASHAEKGYRIITFIELFV